MLYCAAAPEREAHYPDSVVQLPPAELTRQKGPAQWGTASHLILEEAIKLVNVDRFKSNYLPPNLGGYCSLVPNSEGYQDSEYAQMCEVAQVALDYAFGPAIAGATSYAVNTEQRVYPGAAIGVSDDLDGTADVQVVLKDRLEVIDLKSGRGHVEADDEQLRYYAVGALLNYVDALGDTDIKTVRTTIVQPLGENPQSIRSHDYTPTELFTWMNEVVYPAYMASLDPNAVATPSKKGCKWCKVVQCEERAEWLINGVTQINQPVPTRNEPHIPDVSTLSDEQLQAIHDYAPMMQAFIKVVDSFITEQKRKDPARFPLLSFKTSLGNKKWTLTGKQLETRLKNWKFKKAEYSVSSVKSPTQMLKGASKEQAEKLNTIIVRPETGYKLTPTVPGEDSVDPRTLGIILPETSPADIPAPTPADDAFACLN